MKLLSYHHCSSQPTLHLLSLFLLVSISSAYPLPDLPVPISPGEEHSDWAATLLQLQASLGLPAAAAAAAAPAPALAWRLLKELRQNGHHHSLGMELEAKDSHEPEDEGWERELAGQFTDHPLETLRHLDVEEEEGVADGKRNVALTSIAGGLQAFNRQKGGFGFRFGRK